MVISWLFSSMSKSMLSRFSLLFNRLVERLLFTECCWLLGERNKLLLGESSRCVSECIGESGSDVDVEIDEEDDSKGDGMSRQLSSCGSGVALF